MSATNTTGTRTSSMSRMTPPPQPVIAPINVAINGLILKALDFKINPFIATLMGAITGCGGGVMRDMLLVRVPVVLVADIYASAALLGAAVVVIGRRLGCPPAMAAVLGFVVCFALR